MVGTDPQALVRDPLAEPYPLGVSSGASLGAVAVIVLGVTVSGPVSLSAAASAGALSAPLLVYATAHSGDRTVPSAHGRTTRDVPPREDLSARPDADQSVV